MTASKSFNPKTDIPALTDKVILITGGTAGLGAGSVACLAEHSPAHIIFTGRKQSAADALISRVKKQSPSTKITFVPCDISSLSSVRTAATTILTQISRLDILMLNAGIMATDPSLSADGYESQFATNHLGHALLTNLLLPTLLHTAHTYRTKPRIISLSSVAYGNAPSVGIDYATLRTTQPNLGGIAFISRWSRYGQSKLANLLYARALATHHPEILSIAVHPGFIFTGLFDGVSFIQKVPVYFMSIGKTLPVDQGHFQQCWAATTDAAGLQSGAYYEPMGRKVVPKTKVARDVDGKAAEELWVWTQKQFEMKQ